MGGRKGYADPCIEINSDAFQLGDPAGTKYPLISVDGDLLLLELTPKIIGIAFEPHFNKPRLSLLKVSRALSVANKKKRIYT